MENKFYMLCTRETVGSNTSFHCKDGMGYSSDIDKAHVYTQEEAQKAWEMGRNIDQPVCASDVDSMSVCHVDHQYIPGGNPEPDDATLYVGYIMGDWDGNDVFWLNDRGYPSTDFSLVKKFSAPDLSLDNVVWLPFEIADQQKRRTFPIAKFNARTMVQGRGLLIPDWLKKQRRRKGDSGKTRWNCPCCGKISWQFNPYDYDGCLDWSCEAHRDQNY